jgi:hypothetical protein
MAAHFIDPLKAIHFSLKASLNSSPLEIQSEYNTLEGKIGIVAFTKVSVKSGLDDEVDYDTQMKALADNMRREIQLHFLCQNRYIISINIDRKFNYDTGKYHCMIIFELIPKSPNIL